MVATATHTKGPSTNTLVAPVAYTDSAATVARYLDAFTSPANTDVERVP